MIEIDIHHWLNIKWALMREGHAVVPVFKGYMNALVTEIYNRLDKTEQS